MSWNDDWASLAACRDGDDPDALFVPGAAQHVAKAICRDCPVRTECLAEALDNRMEWGVWGGMTERERRAILRRRPTVTSWRKLLQAERAAFERQQVMARSAARVSARTAPAPVPAPVRAPTRVPSPVARAVATLAAAQAGGPVPGVPAAVGPVPVADGLSVAS